MQDWKGLRILNTRPLGQNKALSQAIRDVGGVPIECPALAIEPLEDGWWRTLGDLNVIDWAIFISTNAVQYCFERLHDWPESIQVAAVGQATARALRQCGVRVDAVPLFASSEDLLNLEAMQHVRDKTMLLVKGEHGRALLADTLIQRGALVRPLAVYRRVLPRGNQDDIDALWHDDAVDAIIFTSEASMHNLFQLFGPHASDWLRSKPCYVKGKRLAKVAADLGILTITSI